MAISYWTQSERSYDIDSETQHGHRGSTTHGNVYEYNQRAPGRTATFHSDTLPKAQAEALEAAALVPWSESGSTVQITRVGGVVYEGKIKSLRIRDINGTDDYKEADLTLNRPSIVTP
jgi:hypothetical protein